MKKLLVAAALAVCLLPALAWGQDDPAALAAAALQAAQSHQWQALAAALLGLLALIARRYTPELHFFQTGWGALALVGGLSFIGSLIPVLQAHAFTPFSLATAGVAGVAAVLAILPPRKAAQAGTLLLFMLPGCGDAATNGWDALCCALLVGYGLLGGRRRPQPAATANRDAAEQLDIAERQRRDHYFRTRVPATFGALALLACSLGGCKTSPAVIATTATIATVQTADEGVDYFEAHVTDWEVKIAQDAVQACKGSQTRAAYKACTDGVTAPRRQPIDRVKLAIKLYRTAVVTGQGVDQALSGLTGALAGVGLAVAGGAK